MDSFHIMPIGSIYAREEKFSIGYLDIVQNLPFSIKGMVSSTEIASYIKGIARTYDIPEDKQPSISFAILEISIGKKTLAQLPAILSTELKLPNDKAQKMAAEIEKDVFGPVKGELDEFLSRKVASQPRDAVARKSLQNVLNLKELPARKVQTQLPANSQIQLPRPASSTPGATRIPLTPSLSPSRERGVEGRTPSVFPAGAPRPTTPKPRFPLPPKPQNPIRFT